MARDGADGGCEAQATGEGEAGGERDVCVSRQGAGLASEAGAGPLGAVPPADGRHRAAVGEARQGGGHFVGDGTEGGQVRHPDGGARLHHKG